ncbi:MAG TPA: low-specificity L-threonine aldolase, partial [Arenimonas sp.]|nr:low-specificity L-threonine aldolase [Arenimonas sp.]
RQAGLLAAMANHALDHHVARLADDHRRAAELAEALRAIPGLSVEDTFTNLVFVTVPEGRREALTAHMESRGIRIAGGYGTRIRLVTHLDVDDAGLARTIAAFQAFFQA